MVFTHAQKWRRLPAPTRSLPPSLKILNSTSEGVEEIMEHKKKTSFSKILFTDSGCSKPSVRFSEQICYRTIPGLPFYEQNGISHDMWYTKCDFIHFKKSAMLELQAYALILGVDLKSAMRNLYQSSTPSTFNKTDLKSPGHSSDDLLKASYSKDHLPNYKSCETAAVSVEFVKTSRGLVETSSCDFDDEEDILQYL